MSFVNLQHSYSQITEVLGLGNLLTVPVPPQLGYFSTLKELSRLHRADVEDSLDWLQADVRSYEWTLVAENEPHCRWGMRNCSVRCVGGRQSCRTLRSYDTIYSDRGRFA